MVVVLINEIISLQTLPVLSLLSLHTSTYTPMPTNMCLHTSAERHRCSYRYMKTFLVRDWLELASQVVVRAADESRVCRAARSCRVRSWGCVGGRILLSQKKPQVYSQRFTHTWDPPRFSRIIFIYSQLVVQVSSTTSIRYLLSNKTQITAWVTEEEAWPGDGNGPHNTWQRHLSVKSIFLLFSLHSFYLSKATFLE